MKKSLINLYAILGILFFSDSVLAMKHLMDEEPNTSKPAKNINSILTKDILQNHIFKQDNFNLNNISQVCKDWLNFSDQATTHLKFGYKNAWAESDKILQQYLFPYFLMIRFENLTSLDLWCNNDITDNTLLKLLQLTKLSLHLGSNKNITDQGLSKLPNLLSLDLGDFCSITDKGLSKLTSLTSLHLTYRWSEPKITNQGLSSLANLISLDLEDSENITDEGLSNLTNLTDLNLCENDKITDEGLENLNNLTNLNLDNIVN